jgi:hypothetical protein
MTREKTGLVQTVQLIVWVPGNKLMQPRVNAP